MMLVTKNEFLELQYLVGNEKALALLELKLVYDEKALKKVAEFLLRDEKQK